APSMERALPAWRWWSGLVRTPAELAEQLHEALAARRAAPHAADASASQDRWGWAELQLRSRPSPPVKLLNLGARSCTSGRVGSTIYRSRSSSGPSKGQKARISRDPGAALTLALLLLRLGCR